MVKKSSDLSNVSVGSIARMPAPTVSSSAPVSEIVSLMVNCNIGSVIITRKTEPIGIVTERDVIKRILHAKKDAREVIAQEIMTAPLITISHDRTIDDALKIMQDNDVRRLVVLKDQSKFGLLTERRLLRAKFM